MLVDTASECYEALGIAHAHWKPVPGRFKDYIAIPKSNLYQSLHTTVVGPKGEHVEFQIRTEDMHRVAEYGIAAHWKYKEQGQVDDKDSKAFGWLRQFVEWQKDLPDNRQFMDSVKLELFHDVVYVFTPKGTVKELPKGATPIDFAYAIHTEVGDHCVSTVNTVIYLYYGNPVAPSQENPTAVLDTGCVMVQHLEEISGNHFDSTGNANNGTTVVVSNQDAAGIINGADEFDGSTSYIRVPDAASLQFGAGSFTAEAWIYPHAAAGADGVRIVNNRGTGTGGAVKGWQLKIANSGSSWVVGRSAIDDGSNNFKRYDGTTTYAYNQWYQVVMVYEADQELRFYVDGSLDGTLAVGSYGDISNTLPTVIGASLADLGVEGSVPAQVFDGRIDEVRISDAVRSSAWIQTSYVRKIISSPTRKTRM